MGKEILLIENDPDAYEENYSNWVLIASDRTLLDRIEADGYGTPRERETAREIRWTDDYCNLLEVINWD